MTPVPAAGELEPQAVTAAVAVRYCRQRAKLSQRALGRRAGVSAAYVSRVEDGTIQPSLRAFARLATELGLSDQEIGIVIRQEAAQNRVRGS